jgi:hypothetical protein
MPTFHSKSILRLLATLTIVAGAATSLAACNRDDPAAQTLQDATTKIHSISPTGIDYSSRDFKEKTLKSVIASLQSLGSAANSSQKASAAILLSQANAALAAGPAQDAADNEREALNRITPIRAALNQYLAVSGRARAAAFDPTQELLALDKEDQDRQKQIADATAKKTAVESKLSQLHAQAKSLADQGKAKQNEAALLRQQAVSQSATAAEKLLVQASQIGRDADKLEVDSANLEAQAEQLAPEVPAADLELARLTSQRDLLTKAKQDVQKRDQASKAEATSARAEAAKIAEQIATMLKSLDDLRQGDLATHTQEAAAGFTKAASTAKSAASEMRSAANLSAAAAQQSLGDVLWERAHGLSSYAQVLTALAAADPALPNADAIKAQAKKAADDRDAAATSAAEAYQAAKAGYAASGATGETKQKLEALEKRLIELIKLASSGKIDLEPPPATSEEKPAEEPKPASDAKPADTHTDKPASSAPGGA